MANRQTQQRIFEDGSSSVEEGSRDWSDGQMNRNPQGKQRRPIHKLLRVTPQHFIAASITFFLVLSTLTEAVRDAYTSQDFFVLSSLMIISLILLLLQAQINSTVIFPRMWFTLIFVTVFYNLLTVERSDTSYCAILVLFGVLMSALLKIAYPDETVLGPVYPYSSVIFFVVPIIRFNSVLSVEMIRDILLALICLITLRYCPRILRDFRNSLEDAYFEHKTLYANFDLLVHSVPVGIVICDDKHVLFQNKETTNVLGLSKEEVSGQLFNLEEQLEPAEDMSSTNSDRDDHDSSRNKIDSPKHPKQKKKIIQTLGAFIEEYICEMEREYRFCDDERRKDVPRTSGVFRLQNPFSTESSDYGDLTEENDSKILQVTAKIISWDESPRVLLTIKDITIYSNYNRIVENDKFHKKLLRAVSHEYKTPLNAIKGMLHSLEQMEVIKEDEEAMSYIEVANSASEVMLMHIRDLVDYFQIVSDNFHMDIKVFSPKTLVEETLTLMKPKFAEKELDFVVDVAEDLPEDIETDDNRLKQILFNILDNAAKFTHTGGRVSFRVSTVEGDKGVMVKFEIEDTGIGISPEDLGTLFTEFGTVNSPETNLLNPQGVGIGLCVCHVLSRKMGQGLYVRSEPGTGSIFWFTVFKDHHLFHHQQTFDSTKNGNIDPAVLSELRDMNEHPLRRNLDHTFLPYALTVRNRPGGQATSRHITEEEDDEEERSETSQSVVDVLITSRRQKPKPKTGKGSSMFVFGNLGAASLPLYTRRKRKTLTRPDEKGLLLSSSQIGLTISNTNEKPCNCPHVLIVDDEELNRIVLSRQLEKLGYRFDLARNGLQALKKVTERVHSGCCQKYQLIIMDYQMPEMSGPKATRYLTAKFSSGELPFQPIIGHTAYDGEFEISTFKSAGVRDFLRKPVKVDDLKTLLQKWVEA